MPIFATARGASGPSSMIMSARLRASSISITIQGRPPSVTTSNTWTTLGCDRLAAARASRSVRSYMASRSLAASAGGSTTSLTATSRRSTVSAARQTVPMPPLPIAVRRAYRPPMTVPGAARPLEEEPLQEGAWVVTTPPMGVCRRGGASLISCVSRAR
jgi:hypothetical protein